MKEVKHSGEFLSRAGVAWKVEIWQEVSSASGDTPADLDFPPDEPVVIEWDEKAKEEPIYGSCATIRIISPTDRAYVGLYAIEAGSVGVDIYRK